MKLEDLINKHRDEHVFIIGTGPSLNDTDMNLLKNETVFGCNTLYEGMDKWDISCKYYTVGDCKVWNDHYKKVLDYLGDVPCFVSEEIYRTYPDTLNENCLWVKSLPPMWIYKNFSGDMIQGKFSGDNTIIDCLQQAFYLGFKTVYLLGCDCSLGHYVEDVRDDSDMFEKSGGYHGFSNDWKVRFARSFESYKVCKRAYEHNGRKIINCTKNGNLNIFERKRLEDII